MDNTQSSTSMQHLDFEKSVILDYFLAMEVVGFLYFKIILILPKSDPRKAENFDSQFKKLPVSTTPPDATANYILNNMKGDEFTGFSFVNQHF